MRCFLALSALAASFSIGTCECHGGFLARQPGGQMTSYSSSFSSFGHMASSHSRMFSWLSGQDGLMHEQTQESRTKTVQDGSKMTQTRTKRVCRDGLCEEVVMVMEPPRMHARGMPMYNRPVPPSLEMSPGLRGFLDRLMGPPPTQAQEQASMGRPEMIIETAPPLMMERPDIMGRPDMMGLEQMMRRPGLMGPPEMGRPGMVVIGSPDMMERPEMIQRKQPEIIIEIGRGTSGFPMEGLGLGPQLKSPEPLRAIPRPPPTKAQPLGHWNRTDLVKFGAAFLALVTVYAVALSLLKCRRSDAREAARERPLQSLAEPLAPAPMQVMEKTSDVIQDPREAAADAVATYLPRLYDKAIAQTDALSVRMYMSRLYTRILA